LNAKPTTAEELLDEVELDVLLEVLVATELVVLTLVLVLDLLVEVAELVEDTGQPLTTPYGAGCAAQVALAIQLLPFS
jgi:hypothetical protein